jgi:ABC-type lipopolysaccharide export system ATPase subunit
VPGRISRCHCEHSEAISGGPERRIEIASSLRSSQ